MSEGAIAPARPTSLRSAETVGSNPSPQEAPAIARRPTDDHATAPRFSPMALTGKDVSGLPSRTQGKMLWNEDFPGIYVGAIRSDADRECAEQVRASLDEMLRFPESRAILVNISARHRMDPHLTVTIEPFSRLDNLWARDLFGYARVCASKGTSYIRALRRSVLTRENHPGSEFSGVVTGKGAKVLVRLQQRHARMRGLHYHFTSALAHELIHALHFMCGALLQSYTGSDPGKPGAVGGKVVEECFTVGLGPAALIQNPLTENSYRTARNIPMHTHYGANTGNKLAEPWLRNSGDDDPPSRAANATDKHRYMQSPRTSPSMLARKEYEADQRWIAALENLNWVKRAEASLAASTDSEQGVFILANKRLMQDCLFAECLHLYKDGRHGAAHYLASRFPSGMLQHRDGFAKELQRFTDRVSLRHTEQIQKMWSEVRFEEGEDSLSARYYRSARAVYGKNLTPAERIHELTTLKSQLDKLMRETYGPWNRRRLSNMIARPQSLFRNNSGEKFAFEQAKRYANLHKIDAMLAYEADRSERLVGLWNA